MSITFLRSFVPDLKIFFINKKHVLLCFNLFSNLHSSYCVNSGFQPPAASNLPGEPRIGSELGYLGLHEILHGEVAGVGGLRTPSCDREDKKLQRIGKEK